MEYILQGIAWVKANINDITQIIGTFAIIAGFTANRSKTGSKIEQFFLDAINFLGANFGKASNDPAVD